MLQKIDEHAYQARCDRCLRASPTLDGSETTAGARLTTLGWAKTPQGDWSCTVCQNRISGDWPRAKT